jgi:glycosyltransferase involved in cell wall biosynthesis
VRVLVAHSRYLSGTASGENQVVDDEVRLLSGAGHEVARWEPEPAPGGAAALLRTGAHAVWSRAAAREMQARVGDSRAEVVHVHNLFPGLSPAVLRAARDIGVPTVMTLHNYRLMCLPANLLRDERNCEECVGRVPWRGVVHRCYRGSALGSAVLATSLTLHRRLGTFALPELLLAVSRFVRDKHVQGGCAPDRIRVKPNFAWEAPARSGPGDGFLFVGRLSPEKGVAGLLSTWRGVRAPLVVVGDGPDAARLRAAAPANVEFTGALEREAVDARLREARALVVPSICYEGQPRTILEAYAAGVPVIAHDIGGLPEVVVDDESGRLVRVGDADGWARAVEQLGDDRESERLGAGARRLWERLYSPDAAIENLERAYRTAAARASG